MAEDIVGGLFGINPAMYQQQQQQQVLKNAIAMQQLDPFQRAGVGLQQAGYNFAGALGGAMGGVDPQLQRISALNAISKQIDQTNPESMLQGAKMLADAGFMQEALGLAQYARKANSELALAQQRMRADKAAAPETTNEIKNATAAADLSGFEKGTFEYNKVFKDELARLTAKPGKDAAVSQNIQDSLEIGRLVGKIAELDELPPDLQDPVRKKQLEAQLASLTKNTKQSEFAQILQDAGYIPGSEDYKTKMKEFANLKLTKEPETKTEAMKNAIAFADASPYKKGTPEYNKVYLDKFTEFTEKAEKAPPAVGADREAIAKEIYFKPFSALNQAEIKAVNAIAEKRDLDARKASVSQTVTNVNAFTPASVTAQQDFIKSATDKRKALENAPDTITNIEAAKQLIPTASTFMGTGGEPLLAAASFLNNRLGFAISTKGVTDATVLRTRLFEGILDNLKKLDSQPSQEQQRVLAEALGNLGTDPAALEQILDRIAETVRARVERYNAEVTDAEGRGVKFPYTPQLKLPPRKSKPADGAALIPTGKPVAKAIPQSAIDALKAGQGTDAQFDEQFGAGAAKRVRGAK